VAAVKKQRYQNFTHGNTGAPIVSLPVVVDIINVNYVVKSMRR